MGRFDTPVPSAYLADSRFAPFIKYGWFWARHAIKSAMRPLFHDLEAAASADELAAVVYTDATHITLDACRLAVPEWACEFEERFNERMRQLATGKMPEFTIEPAVRGIRNVIIGICGAPGGGKTCSALRLATGLARGGEIVLIDTECGRATEFAAPRGESPSPNGFDPDRPLFAFSLLELPPPHSPDRYRLAVAAAARRKPAVLIIDNITHEQSGIGGQLDIKDASDDKFGWREPKRQHSRLMAKLMAHPWYVILTIRAKEKIKPAGKGQGIVNEGWLPQCDGGLPYDCTLLQLVDGGIPNGANERPWKLPASLRRLVPLDRPLDEDCGRAIANWCQPEGTWTHSDD